jgi:hypothetical protein
LDLVEENILVASWVDDLLIPQRELESRKLFFMNESILTNQEVKDHFRSKNAKKFYSQGVEFVCWKGSCPERSEEARRNMFDTQGKLP